MSHVVFQCALCAMPHPTTEYLPGLGVPRFPATMQCFKLDSDGNRVRRAELPGPWVAACDDCSLYSAIGLGHARADGPGAWTVTRASDSRRPHTRETFTEGALQFFGDPRCPGCSKVHERTRVGESLTFEVKDACSWSGKGKVIPGAKMAIRERLAIAYRS